MYPQVLQHLNYIDDEETVLLKGRVACEVTSSEALLVTELIFQNVLSVGVVVRKTTLFRVLYPRFSCHSVVYRRCCRI